MTNIRTVLQLFDLETSGFKAVEALHLFSNPHGEEATLSTLPASVLQAQGVQAYFAPRFERGQVFETAADMVEANIPVDCYMISEAPEEELETVIVSRHNGTIEILKDKLGDVTVLDDNVTADDIKGKAVVGTLPPFLITECASYTPVTIANFDYNKDGDLQGEELHEHIQIGKPFTLEKLELNIPDLSNIDSVLELFTDEDSYGDYYNKSACITLEPLDLIIEEPLDLIIEEPLDLTIEIELEECLDYLGLKHSSITLSGGFEEISVTSYYSKEEDKVYILPHYCG